MADFCHHQQFSIVVTQFQAVFGQSQAAFSTVHIVSLIPRLFPPPVFDHLQYASTEGEGLGDLVTCDDIR